MNQSNNSQTNFVIRSVQNIRDSQALYVLMIRRVINLAPAIFAFLLILRCPDILLSAGQLLKNPFGFLLDILIDRFIIGVIALVLTATCLILFSYFDNQKRYCIAVNSSHAIAYIRVTCRSTYSILNELYVHPAYRYQGVGSQCIQYLSEMVTKPIYVLPGMGTREFYAQLGFLPVPNDDVPQEISNLSNALLILR
ncbi:GNAT family N-acetyltransferase [Nostoc sp.]|uniref:GNAT family N-acetyltransferase n=1 Tax=Nostoc sp. TaxID=1180 RepID=UPI002FFCC500